MKKYVAIVDYGMGNLFSVKNACGAVGLVAIITNDPRDIDKASCVILPGVGAFGDAMENLEKLELIPALKGYIASKRLFVGICLGMQLLFSESEEFGVHKGLDIIKGTVRRFPEKDKTGVKNKVPHVGWNKVFNKNKEKKWEKTLLKDINNNEYMYFVHSYYCTPDDKGVILSQTTYAGITFASSVLQDNVFAVQYHPEKSGEEGIKIYRNIVNLIA